MTAAGELVLPFVVRIERADPPQRTDALEAVAQAALAMLTTEWPQFRAAVEAWDGQRIRKVVRRARGAGWRGAVALDGQSWAWRSAQVRVFAPVPVDAWPPELAKLQVGGTNLVDDEPPPPPDPAVPLVLLSPHAEMTTGKAMAQAAHAAQLGWRAMTAHRRGLWRADGFALAVRDATRAQWQAAVDAGAPVVHDGGFTEVEPGTATALVVLPA